jgi:hypothetical protein
MEHELNIEYNEACNFFIVTCPEGCYITDYTSDKNIEEYVTSTQMYIPGKYTADEIKTQYHCITEAEKAEFDKLAEENINKNIQK